MSNTKKLTRKGAASFYVVIFAALVFTVIVLSFVRLAISEANQNISNDLSQSAYDSALAGIEDAKAAIAMCSSDNPNKPGNCDQLYLDDCNAMTNVLYGPGASEDAKKSSVGTDADQSYTCVKLKRDLSDYKVSLSSSTPVAVVPIDATQVKISWFTNNDKNAASNQNIFKNYQDGNFTDFLPIGSPITPPVVSVGFIEENNDHINTIVLRPSKSGASRDNSVELGDVINNPVQKAYQTANGQSGTNEKALIQCDSSSTPACSVAVKAGGNIQYLVLNLPYHEATSVNFTVEKSGNGNFDGSAKFTDQISVDSTGRANDYYRRVEARLQLAPLTFPYPEYALANTNNTNNPLGKYFYVTRNCWTATKGKVESCTDTGSL